MGAMLSAVLIIGCGSGSEPEDGTNPSVPTATQVAADQDGGDSGSEHSGTPEGGENGSQDEGEQGSGAEGGEGSEDGSEHRDGGEGSEGARPRWRGQQGKQGSRDVQPDNPAITVLDRSSGRPGRLNAVRRGNRDRPRNGAEHPLRKTLLRAGRTPHKIGDQDGRRTRPREAGRPEPRTGDNLQPGHRQ